MVSTVNLGGVSAAQAELGTKAHPIYLLLVPSVNTPVIQSAGDAIAQAIYKHTGLYVEAHVTSDYAALIEAFRTAEGDVFGIPTTAQYIEIYNQTHGGVDVTLASVRYGYNYYFSSIYAPRAKGFQYNSLQDLDGKVWCYNDPNSTSGYKYPKFLFDKYGIKIAGTVETGGHVNSMVALLQGQCDFATGYGSPPNPPDFYPKDIRWQWGDDPEFGIWDRWNNKLVRKELRWTGKDLRHAVEKDYPDVWKKIGVIYTVGPIPNDCIAFAKGFPGEKLHVLTDALQWHIHTPEGQKIWSDPGFYEWNDMAPITDDYYDLTREVLGYPVPQHFIRLEGAEGLGIPLGKVDAESAQWKEIIPIADWGTTFGLSLIGDNDKDGNLSVGDTITLTNTTTKESCSSTVLDLYSDAEGRLNINVAAPGE